MQSPRQQLRQSMAVTSKYAYFDHAAVAPLPSPTAESIQEYAREAHLNGDAVWLDWAHRVEKTREAAARLIGATEEEIALVPNTTYGIQLVAQGFPWRAGDNLVVPANEFPSNLIPWRSLADRGVDVREVTIPPSGEIDLAHLQEHMDSRTRLIAISWVGYASGYRIPLDDVVALAHSKGCKVMLDAIQGLGAFPLDVKQTPVDFLAADGHKWLLGPEGAGLFYCKTEHLEFLTPVGLGWNSLSQGAFDGREHILKSSAGRYEGGTMNMPGQHGLGKSIDLLLSMGLNLPFAEPDAEQQDPGQSLSACILENVRQIEEQLNRSGFKVHMPPDNPLDDQVNNSRRSGILGVTWSGTEHAPLVLFEARKQLLGQNIVTSVRGNRLRISAHAYNNSEDCERLVSVLASFRKNSD